MLSLSHSPLKTADVPLFETQSKICMLSAHKRVTALKFSTAVAFVENNMELGRNGGGTAPTKIYCFPLNFFLPFSPN